MPCLKVVETKKRQLFIAYKNHEPPSIRNHEILLSCSVVRWLLKKSKAMAIWSRATGFRASRMRESMSGRLASLGKPREVRQNSITACTTMASWTAELLGHAHA